MTINATISLARDAYQLAMIELLKAGTLPAALPTRVAWLASLSAAGAPALVLDAAPVNAPGNLSNFHFEDAAYPARSGTYAFIGLLYNGTGGAWARVYLLAGGSVVVNEGGFSLSGAGTIFVHEPASPTEWAWQLLQGDWGAGGPTILLQDLDGGLQATKPTPLEVVDWYDPAEDANASVTTSGAVYVVTEGVIGQDAIFGTRTFKCVAVPSLWVETSNVDPTSGQVVAALGFTPANDSLVAKRSGPNTLTGQLELDGQTAATKNSAMVVGMLGELMAGLFYWSNDITEWSASVVSTGSLTNAVGQMVLNASATAGSSCVAHSDINSWRTWGRAYAGKKINWSRPVVHHVKLCSDSFSGADTVFRLMLGLPANTLTVADFLSAHKGIGIKIVAGLIWIQAANGSAVTLVSTGVSLVGTNEEKDITLMSHGDGNWTVKVNESTFTGTGAPTGDGAVNSRSLNLSLTNGTSAATKRFSILSQKTFQY